MAHTSFFFDLDGTITDSKQGIINSVLYSLNHFGIRASADSLLFFIGPPLKQSFARYFPGDSARVALAVEKYREYFRGAPDAGASDRAGTPHPSGHIEA